MRFIVIVALIALVPALAVAAESPSDTAAAVAVCRLEVARARALVNADTTTMSKMIGDDFVEVSRIGALRTKADNLREIATGVLKLTSVNYEDLSVQVYGDVAVLRGTADNTGVFHGVPFAGKLRYTRVFVRRDGRWQAVAMQHTMIQ